MQKIITTEKLPIKIWTDQIEDGALQQAKNSANLPFAFKWIALMPDVHEGFGMPIGGVLATRNVVIPNAVGVDIGCGVRAIKTNIMVREFLPKRKKILQDIGKSIPLGFKHHKKPQNHQIFDNYNKVTHIIKEQWESIRRQIGTLGGGNYFIEIQRDNDGYVWIMLHSGSRNLGKKVADYYNNLAKNFKDKRYPPVPKEYQLAFLPLDTQEGQNYWKDMNFCIKFAEGNREKILSQVIEIFHDYFTDFRYSREIDVRHNYAALEEHFGEKVVVHRKGAVKATGTVIIPGSMGSPSYIGTGLENGESFFSCSHGAGRRISRRKARKNIPVDAVMRDMRKKDIELVKPKKNDVAEECAAAYKDIDEVMEYQKDLVTIKLKLDPLGVVKG